MESAGMCVLMGTVMGVLTGLGVGGGSLLVLWLTQVLGTAQQEAQGINLLFFLPAAAVAGIFGAKKGRIAWDLAVPAMGFGALAAGLGAWIATGLESGALGKVFGFLLLAAGSWECFVAGRKR